ncbi:TPA: hypothetical protein P1079_000349 [Salmonella enterica subsp. enterica serovar Bareilly]|nr:hypothetical protein [Salmonella enterica subsp. enterica serovar Coleypark]HDN4435866.1 hypothetical protein [Salmonella enterica subsp. enterica serovar Bareilly]HDN4449240.1 hypothetical protein [Salmonella enterica subsp. enterica serovar Bareilly]HDN7333500.1 hypothetical protein [Salmonella enterica subsp. enterica serovar Bareilly]
MSENAQFDFKKHWLALTPDEREAFAAEAGTTSHYIQTHLTGKRKMPGKTLMNGLFKAANSRQWVRTKPELAYFFYS